MLPSWNSISLKNKIGEGLIQFPLFLFFIIILKRFNASSHCPCLPYSDWQVVYTHVWLYTSIS